MFRKVIITGASRGIGKALALEMASRGSHVFLIARDEQALKSLCEEIRSKRCKADYFAADVTDYNSCEQSIKAALQKIGGIDLALLNAGVSGSEKIEEMDAKEFKRIYDVNLFGMTNYLEFIVPLMKAQGCGTIAGVGSLADTRGFPGSAAYCSSKIAVNHLLESARIELAKFNVRVVTIKPGFVETDMTAKNKFKMPFIINSKKAAKIIADSLDTNRKIIAFPWQICWATAIAKIVPNFIFEFFLRKWYNAR